MSKPVRLVLVLSSLLLLPLAVSPARAAQGELFVDVVPSSAVPPGTVLGVTVRVENTSSTETLDNAEVSSSFFDPNLALVPGTVTTRYREVNTPSGTILEGNGPADSDVHVELAPIPPGYKAEVSFQAKVPDLVAAGVEEARAQIILQYADGAFVTIPWDVIVPIEAEPSLVLEKSDGGASVVPGGSVSYRLTVENVGTQEATGLVLADTVPLGTQFVAAGSSAGWSCTNGGGAGGFCSLGFVSLPAGSSRSFDFVLQTDGPPVSAGVDEIRNVASVREDGTNSLLPQEASAEDVTPLLAAPDLRLAKSDGGVTVAAGEVVTYTLSYSNAGTQDATGVVLEETVPFHASFVADASAPGWVCSDPSGGSACSLLIDDLPAGGTGEVPFSVRVAPVVTVGVEEIVNQASVRDDGTNGADPVPGDNQAIDRTPVDAAPDLFLTKESGGTSVQPGETVVYTLSYGNEGTQTATGVALREVVPQHGVFVAEASDPEWTCASGGTAGTSCVRLIGNLSPGDSGSVAFGVRVDPALPPGVEEIVNEATLFDDDASGPDLDPEDDTATVATPVDAAPDLAAMKRADAAVVRPGQIVTYTIRYENLGDQGATGVVLEETVPGFARFEAGSSSPGWSCTAPVLEDGGTSAVLGEKLKAERIQSKLKAERIQEKAIAMTTCAFALGDLPPEASGEAIFAVRLDDAVAPRIEELVNRVLIRDDGANGADPEPGNDEAVVTTPLDAAPDLGVVKGDGGVTAEPGGLVVYTLVYRNRGDQGTSGVVLEETVPEHVRFAPGGSEAGWACDLGVEPGAVCSWEVGELAPEQEGSVRFAVEVDAELPEGVESVVNHVVIRDDGLSGPDRRPEDDESVVTTPLERENPGPGPGPDPEPEPGPDLDLFMVDLLAEDRDESGSLSAGDVVTYSVEVRNLGDGAAEGVHFRVPVPEHTVYAPGSAYADALEVAAISGGVLEVSLGDLGAGETLGMAWDVVIDSELAQSVSEIRAQGSVEAQGLAPHPSDDPATVERDDPTVTDLRAAVGPGDPHDIPTVSEWGLMLLGLILGVAAWRVLA